jgi:hypothetical protein
MRPPRFRLRTLMIVVAIVGIVFGLARRSAVYHQQAERQLQILEMEDFPSGPNDPLHFNLFIEYHVRLMDKYNRAARYPWFPVPPDPPPPQ